jgi:hypothetical protein
MSSNTRHCGHPRPTRRSSTTASHEPRSPDCQIDSCSIRPTHHPSWHPHRSSRRDSPHTPKLTLLYRSSRIGTSPGRIKSAPTPTANRPSLKIYAHVRVPVLEACRTKIEHASAFASRKSRSAAEWNRPCCGFDSGCGLLKVRLRATSVCDAGNRPWTGTSQRFWMKLRCGSRQTGLLPTPSVFLWTTCLLGGRRPNGPGTGGDQLAPPNRARTAQSNLYRPNEFVPAN